MMSLFYLAMNPNLTEKQFIELSKNIMESKAKLLKTSLDNARELPPEWSGRYLSLVMPLVML